MSEQELGLTDEQIQGEEPRDLAVREEAMPTVGGRPDVDWTAVLNKIIAQPESIGYMERVLAMIENEDAKRCKEEFDYHLGQCIAALPVLTKKKGVTNDSGKQLYKYAPIEDIVRAVKPTIVQHGFTWKFEEQDVDGKAVVSCVVRGYNHEERTTVAVDVPAPITKTDDPMKMRGKASTYARRYAFTGAFSIVLANEDEETDEFYISMSDALSINPYYERLLEARNPQELTTIGKDIADELTAIEGTKDSHKHFLVRNAYRAIRERMKRDAG